MGRDVARITAGSWAVVGLRMARLAVGGPAASAEAQRMVTEKAAALVDAQLEVARAVATGRVHEAPARVLALYARRVAANQRRLTRA